MINIIWLKTFCTLADIGHFTRTAEILFMTQSGVSQQIKKLEQQLSTPLLIREGKSFILTDAGLQLYQEGQSLVTANERLGQQLRQDDAFEGRIRLSTPGSIGLNLYPFLLDLQQQHPQLIMTHAFAPNKSIERDVRLRHVDLGIMTQPSSCDDVLCEAIGQEALVLVTHSSIQKIDWDLLLQLGFISHPDGNHHCNTLLSRNFPQFEHVSQFTEKGFSNQISLILEPVSRGFGFSVLPMYAAKAFAAQHKICIHILSVAVNETLYLCRHTQVSQSQRIKFISERIKRFLAIN
ncbi:transcriptional regulator, LysR family protein [Glaciecola punicea ACAM 611]|uniref:Transcriptional regulator, LysR family protein n=1 Tax=Glaciecola punicea ACAM 611 TaxID=1121923 RepID=H5T7G4_9ALTE|nr:LysR family transcriptional regulator [Glaciecola punicea]OFA32873.1 LysR family transcriptional regulator [Glaciecola punicea]GAB54241.1 transcriptional regulator, LysR family protein [Glaciecola punicea ACAM 611]